MLWAYGGPGTLIVDLLQESISYKYLWRNPSGMCPSIVVGEYIDVSIKDSFVGFFDGLTRRRDTRGGHCR